ncbi:MAG: 50S ribosomal protein L1 [Candidatus Micrarchaeales archaeon]
METEKIKEAIEKVLQEKGKRNFVQSVEMIINFRNIDFSKQENRINLTIYLPFGLGKEKEVVIFSDSLEAKKFGKVITSKEIEGLAKNKKELEKLKNAILLADQKSIPLVLRYLGQFLGPRGKIPKVITKNIKEEIDEAKSSIKIQTKGKYLPTLQCAIGSEIMKVEELTQNAQKVLEEISARLPKGNIKSIYFKLTMGKPVKVEL